MPIAVLYGMCPECPHPTDCEGALACSKHGNQISKLPVARPSQTLDLSSPSDALRLTTNAFAAELHQRLAGKALAPHFIVAIAPPGAEGPPIHYVLTDLLRPGSRVEGTSPDEVLRKFLEAADVWKEDRP